MTKTIFIFTLLICFHFIGQSQSKNDIYVGLRIFDEIDKPFALKKNNEKNTYLFNTGYGVRIKYLHRLSKMFSVGAETGGWYMLNNAKNTDPIYGDYKTRNIIIPLLCVIHIRPFTMNNYNFSIGLKAGTGYVQTINKFDNNQANVYPKWSSLFEFSLNFSLKNGVRPRFPFRAIGYGNEFIQGRIIRSWYFDVLDIKI